MADERESRYAFGIDPDEVAAKLAGIVAGIGDGSVAVQFGMDVALASIEDFEFKQITLMYAQKRPRPVKQEIKG